MFVRTHKNTAKVDYRWVIGLLFAEGIAYVFGMLLNGYPAVVMEVPKAIIINNTKKSRNPKGYLYGVKNCHKK